MVCVVPLDRVTVLCSTTVVDAVVVVGCGAGVGGVVLVVRVAPVVGVPVLFCTIVGGRVAVVDCGATVGGLVELFCISGVG